VFLGLSIFIGSKQEGVGSYILIDKIKHSNNNKKEKKKV